MSENRSRPWVWVVIGGGAFVVFVLAIFVLVLVAVKSGDKSEAGGGFGAKIGVVEVSGVILDSREFLKQVKRYSDDDSIKAIIIQINSPGGGAAASQEMYQGVKRAREKKNKPVIAVIGTVGASGGYYIASAAEKIYANNASIVGSIGVIAQWVNYGELLHWAKLKDVTLKAGELKDAGTPTREMTPREREYLQGLIDDMHVQFIHDVAVGRGMKDDDLRPLATGQVWTGQQAQPLKLVDRLSDFQAAVDETAKAAGIKGEPTIVRPEKNRRSLFDIFFNDASDLIPDRARLLEKNVGFYFLWQ